MLRDAPEAAAPQDEVGDVRYSLHPEEAPFETPLAAAPQGKRAISKSARKQRVFLYPARLGVVTGAQAFKLNRQDSQAGEMT
jgi:hypothetical protein